jgi:hypothetical protein
MLSEAEEAARKAIYNEHIKARDFSHGKWVAGEIEGGFFMANNRLFLRCKRSGLKVLIAKYYPSTGWYVFHKGLSRKLDEMFHEDDFPGVDKKLFNLANTNKIFARGGMWSSNVHELVYETDREEDL